MCRNIKTLFNFDPPATDDEVRAAWHWIDSVADAWKNADLPLQPYAAGTWGPAEAAGFLPGDVIDTAHGDPA